MMSAVRHPTRRALCTIAASVVLGLLWSLAGYCSHLHRSNNPANAQDAPCSLCMQMERFASPPTKVAAIAPVITSLLAPLAIAAPPAVRLLQFRSYLSRAPPSV